MSISTFAAIDVGSNELSMKIFEISKKYGIKELEHVRHTIELGSDTYTYGKISHALVNELCQVLVNFTQKMEEYQVEDYTAYATSAIREASNSLLILDQIKLHSGLKVKILSNSEQRILCYKSIALKETTFNQLIQKGTAIVDVGAGSIQISLFNKETLVTTQNIKLGSLRIREVLAKLENETTTFNNLISEYITKDINTFKFLFLQNMKIEHIIAVGDNISELVYSLHLPTQKDSLDKSQFEEVYSRLRTKSNDSLSRDLYISKEQAALVLPTAMIYHKIFTETGAQSMWIPGVTLCDGMAAEYADKKEKIIPSHNFSEDIVASARKIADRYLCNLEHISNLEYLALNIFDCIKKLHGLGRRERLLLQISVILHNCGEYINMNDIYQNSYHIIMSTEIIGLSHLEREIIANIVKYNSNVSPALSGMPDIFDRDTYMKIAKLSAILHIANAMDISHKQKFSKVKLQLKDLNLIITADTLDDITLERGLFEQKATFFEEVYGISPVLKQKRSI